MKVRLSRSIVHIVMLLSLLAAFFSSQPAAPAMARGNASGRAVRELRPLLATITVTPATSPTASDNDYTRIDNAIQAATPTDIIKLLGTFDWTEANAAASWALGSDGVASTGDDYENSRTARRQQCNVNRRQPW